jgi:hypothetical protein
LKRFNKASLCDAAKFLAHDLEIEGVGIVAAKATEGVAAISLYLGISDIIDDMTNGGGVDPPPPINVTAIKNDLYSLSSSSTLAITGLNNTTTSILGYINGTTRFSNLNVSNLNVSGNSIFNNATFISSLNVSGFSILNSTSINGILNVSSNSIFNSATFTSSLNVSGSTMLNNVTINGILNISSNSIFNNATFTSSLNVSGFSILIQLVLMVY